MSSFFTPSQIRAACGLIGWSASGLAERIGVSKQMISSYLSGKSGLSATNLEKIAHQFDMEGVEFTTGEGVKKRENTVRVYEGKKGFWDFYDDIYETAKAVGGEFYVNNVSERIFESWLQEKATSYKADMAKLNQKVYMKIIVEEGDNFFTATEYAQYRWAKKEKFSNASFYVYGDKLAILLFEENNVFVYVIDEKRIADEYRKQFITLWEQADEPPSN